jgi:glycosyltransferase involved in cell wall biosynthesis
MLDVAPSRLTIIHTESQPGGGGQTLRVLRESLCLAARGYPVSVACRPDSVLSSLAQQAGLPVYHFAFPRRGFFSPSLIWKLYRLFRQLKPDVVHTHTSIDSWAAGIAARLAGAPVVVRTRHIQAPVSAGFFNRLLYGRIADRVITTGEPVADTLARELRLPRSHFISIPTGVDLGRFTGKGAREKVRSEWGLTPEQPAIGMVAAFRKMKNIPLFLEVAQQLNAAWPQARFFIIGDGPLRPSLEAYAEELGIKAVVHFTGHRSDIPDVLAALDLVVLTSSRGEGVPQSLTQALAMRRPVAATDVGGVADIVRPEQTGLLVPPDNLEAMCGAIDRLLRDSALAARLAFAGRQLVEESFSEEKMTEAVENLLLALRREKSG